MKENENIKGLKARITYDLRKWGLPDIPFLGWYCRTGATPHLPHHIHKNTYEICFLSAGSQLYQVEGRDFLLKGGDIYITFPDEPHGSGGHPQGKGILYWIQIIKPVPGQPFLNLSPKTASPLAKGLLGIKQRYFSATDEFAESFKKVQNIADSKHPCKLALLQANVIELVANLIEAEKLQVPAESETFEHVLGYIEQNICEPISVSQLAKVSGYSVSWFKNSFRKHFGMPPAEYVMRRKIDKASRILEQGKESVTSTAYKLGFSSSQYFATVFKRFTNTSPGDIARKNR